MHVEITPSTLLAGMPVRSKGGRRAPFGDVPRSGACGEAPEPIGSLTDRLSTKISQGLKNWEERPPRDGGPATAKKRRTNLDSDVTIETEDLLNIIENVVAKACRGFVVPAATNSSAEAMQSLRIEMGENISRVQDRLMELLNDAMERLQVQADTQTDAVLERVVQHIHDATKQTNNDAGTAATVHTMPDEATQSLRSEMKENIAIAQAQLTELFNAAMAKMQAESDRRAEAMLERLVRDFREASVQANKSAAAVTSAQATPGLATKTHSWSQPTQSAQRTWADITRAGTQSAAGWATVVNRKEKLKKHPLDQRRILFSRDSRMHHCDTRDIMFDVNKALAHTRADVAVRLIKLKYTEKGNLSGVLREHACAEDLLEYAPAVMAAVQKLDPAVINVEKTEKWRKLRVHGVALDRYMTESGLDLAQEEIEVMTGSQLPYAPRWIKSDTLAERFDSGAIKRSTLVLTVKTKHAADTIMAKGLSFGGRRHEAERFWEKGEGKMCMQCCGHDHFVKCTEMAKCYICAGEHEGAKHQCAAEGCSKKAEPCEHHMAKCANCGGAHVATSRKCPERFSSRQKRADDLQEMRSSPPLMDTGSDKEDSSRMERQEEMDAPQLDLEQSRLRQETTIMSDMSVDDSLPDG